MMIRTKPGLSGPATGTYTNVNDRLYLGKTVEEIARLHAEAQGISYTEALRDPSIRLFTDPAYRESVTKPLPVTQLQQADINWLSDTGAPQSFTRSTGRISRQDAEVLAKRIGGTVGVATGTYGAGFEDYTITMPSGLKVDAHVVAAQMNDADTPEQVYSYVSQLQRLTDSSTPGVKEQVAAQKTIDALRPASTPGARLTPASTAPSASTNTGTSAVQARGRVNAGIPGSTPGATTASTTPGSNRAANNASWLSRLLPEEARTDSGYAPSVSSASGTIMPDTNLFDSITDSPVLLIGVAAGLYFLFRGGK